VRGERRGPHAHPVIQRQRHQDCLHPGHVLGSPQAQRAALAGQRPEPQQVSLPGQLPRAIFLQPIGYALLYFDYFDDEWHECGCQDLTPVALTDATDINKERSLAVVDMKLEIVVVPVADVDRAKDFYKALGWREDADYAAGADFRVVQLTPPGSACSVIFGTGVTSAAPGSAEGLQLTVTDIEAARAELAGRGAKVSEVFHDAGGVFHHAGTEGRVAGPAPDHKSYGSFASFSDPDGNGWLLQEITTRLPGR
jgi:catechol 2,3-dioxygenase-like lactoylglutathione lyase family enzyme